MIIETQIETEEFQFHNGSIKSNRQRDFKNPKDIVSIPQWFD